MSYEPGFPVVPLCKNQLKDINPSDVLCNGLYRKCNTYKAGGGYDQFPNIYFKRKGNKPKNIEQQFVVQLYGCPLECEYCYVTLEGIFGKPVKVSAEQLVQDFDKSGCGTFHLMGGAPALYDASWLSILKLLDTNIPFHSDFVLCENSYDLNIFNMIAEYQNGLYALSVKGNRHWYEQQGIPFSIIEWNMEKLRQSNLDYYFTFTGMTDEQIEEWKNTFPKHDYSDSFKIEVKQYKALQGE